MVLAAITSYVNDPTMWHFNTLPKVLAGGINLILGIGWGLVFVSAAAGFVYMAMSSGNKDKMVMSRKWFTGLGMGTLILFIVTTLWFVIPRLFQNNTPLVIPGVIP